MLNKSKKENANNPKTIATTPTAQMVPFLKQYKKARNTIQGKYERRTIGEASIQLEE